MVNSGLFKKVVYICLLVTVSVDQLLGAEVSLRYYENDTLTIEETAEQRGSYANLGIYPHWCLANINKCNNGFTINFWLQTEARSEDADDVIILTTGGEHDFSDGIYLKQRFGDQYEFGVAKKENLWRVHFRLYSGIVYISATWSAGSGLRLTMNSLLKNSTLPEHKEYSGKDFDSFSEFAIGLRNDRSEITNSTLFHIHDIQLYDSVKDQEVITNNAGNDSVLGCLIDSNKIERQNLSSILPVKECRKRCASSSYPLSLTKAKTQCACANYTVLAETKKNTSSCTGDDIWNVYFSTGYKVEHAYGISVHVTKLHPREYVKPFESVKIVITVNHTADALYTISFGDGTEPVTTAELSINHFWSQETNYTIRVQSSIGMVHLETSTVFEVLNVDEGKLPERVQLFVSETKEETGATYSAHVADNTTTAKCRIGLNPTDDIQEFSVASYVTNKVFEYKYPTFGEYSAELSCENNYGTRNSSLFYLSKMTDMSFTYVSTLQDFILRITSYSPLFTERLTVDRNYANTPLNVKKNLLKKEVNVSHNLLQPFGNVISFISNGHTFYKRVFFVENLPGSAKISPDYRAGAWNLTTNITVKVPPGNHIFVQANFGLGEEESFYIYETPDQVQLVFEVEYKVKGYYELDVVVSNDMGTEKVEELISIEVPLDSIILSVDNITDKTKPVELVVDLNTGSIGPEKMSFEIDHGDGTKKLYTYRSFTENFTPYVNRHVYADWGIYTICVRAFNEIEEISDCALVQVGQNISYIDLKSSTTLRVTTSQYAEFNITYINGTDKTYTVDFGDGTVFEFKDLDMLNNSIVQSGLLDSDDFLTTTPATTTTISTTSITTASNMSTTAAITTDNNNTQTTTVVMMTSPNETNSADSESSSSAASQIPSRRKKRSSAVGLPQSTAKYTHASVVTVKHIYTRQGYFRVRATVKNVFSTMDASLCPMIITDNTDDSHCGTSSVSINGQQSSRTNPLVRVRSGEIRMSVLAISNCGINNGYKYSWTAVELMEDRERPVAIGCELELSDSIYVVPHVSLHFAKYKFVVTAAPIGYKRKASQAEVYINVVPSNPVAHFLGETIEQLFSSGFIVLDFAKSRDPDLITNNRQGVEYDLICFTEERYNIEGKRVMDTFMEGNITQLLVEDILYVDSTQNPLRIYQYQNCFKDVEQFKDDVTITDARISLSSDNLESVNTVFSLIVSKEGRISNATKVIRVTVDDFDGQMNALLNAKNLKDTGKALDIVNQIGTGSGNSNDTDKQEKQDKLKEMVLTVVATVTQYAKSKSDCDRVVGTVGRFTGGTVTNTGRSKGASAISGTGGLMKEKFSDASNDQLQGTIGDQVSALSNVAPVGTVQKTEAKAEKRKRRQSSTGADEQDLDEDLLDLNSYASLTKRANLMKNYMLRNLHDFIFDFNEEFRGAVRTKIDNTKLPKAVLKEDKAALFLRLGLTWDPYDIQKYILNQCEEELEESIKRTKDADKEVQAGTSNTIGAMGGLVLKNMEDERCRRRRKRRADNITDPVDESSTMEFKTKNLKLEIINAPAIPGISKKVVARRRRRKRSADDCGGGDDEGAVGATIAENEENPYTYGPNSDRIQSKVKSIDLSEPGAEEIKITDAEEDIEVNITVKAEVPMHNTTIYQESGGDVVELLHAIPINTNGSSLHFWMSAVDDTGDTKFKVCLVYNVSTPDPTCIDTAILPHPEDTFLEVKDIDYNLWMTLRHIYFPPQNKTKTNGDYAVVVSLESTTMHFSKTVTEITYQYRLWVAGCLFWDEESSSFLNNGTKVGNHTTYNQTQCLTNHLTSFGGDFVVPPNTIDFTNVWAKFKNLNENAAVFSTVVALIGIYIILLVWARRMDKRDVQKWGAAPLDDNLPSDNYHYQLSIQTGSRKKAGTTSKISMILSGEECDTGVRRLFDGSRKLFPRGSILNFILSVDTSLGPLTFLRIWHDNSGSGKNRSWFMDQMQVTDLQTGERFFFLCDRWLAVEEDDGMVDRILPVAGLDDLAAFKQLFSSSAKKKLANDHLWFSVFSRPTRSNFTRCQRISCCVSLLFLTMITNAMWFKSDDNAKQTNALKLGPFSFTLQQIFVSFASTLIVFPVNFIMMTFFRRCRPKKNGVMQKNQQMPKRGKWKNVTGGSQIWGMAAKRTRMQKFKDAIDNLVDSHKRSKYDAGEPEPDEAPEMRIAGVPSSKKPKRKKKPGTLPHWCIYIAYVLCFFSILASGFFTILYSMEWGPEKANEWLTTFLLSFFQSVIVVQPIKVVCLVAFIACVLKKPEFDDDSGEDLNNVVAAHDEEFLKKDNLAIDEIASRRKMANSEFQPPDPAILEEARQKRLMELKMEEVIKEICVYVFFVLILFFLSYQTRDSESFMMAENLKAQFLPGFDKISTADNYWQWIETKFIPALYATTYSNGTTITAWWDKRCIKDLEARRVGLPRLRQLRVKENTCDVLPTFSSMISHCRDEYGWTDDDTKPYEPRWVLPPEENRTKLKEEVSPWVYKDSIDLKSAPYIANIATYKGGGYVYLFERNVTWTQKALKELKEQIWLDVYSRGVFLEFTVYNPNINLFASAIMVQEFLPSGGAMPRTEFKVFRLLSYVGSFGVVVLLFEVLYACFSIYFFVRCINKLRKIGMKYFKQFWSMLEFVLLCFCIAVIAMYAFKQILTSVTMNALKDPTKADYVNFQSMAMYDELFGWMIGIVVFLATVQFLKLLQFNKKMSMLGDTLKVATKDLKVFSIAFLLYFFAFTACGYLLFGPLIVSYNGLITSAESMFAFTLGSFDFEAMANANSVLGPLFFFTFVGVVYVGLMSMFFTIIGDAFTEVKANVDDQSNDYEVVDFMWKRLKGVMGLNM